MLWTTRIVRLADAVAGQRKKPLPILEIFV